MAEGGVRHNTEWTPRHIGRSRHEYEDESRETSTLMDLLGYGPVIKQIRRYTYMERHRLTNYLFKGLLMVCFTAGSKAERLTCSFESDTDMIMAATSTMFVEDSIDITTIPGYICVFFMNLERTSAGYCRLLLARSCNIYGTHFINALCDDGRGTHLLSSTLFVETLKDCPMIKPGIRLPLAGPSQPWYCGPFRCDMVIAIRCHCPSILQTWANRLRHWPPPDVVEKVVSMGAFVTPTSYKGSAFNHIEWRICFNTAETELVKNLNDTQVKIYVILKMINNEILKPPTKEITSYTLKNIVLWLAENNPQTLFHTGSLFHWLHEGLDILRTAISTRQLPYYMIPERNLMAERDIDDEQQRVLVTSITCTMDEGPRVLLRLKKLRLAIVSHPEPLFWYSKMRTELEIIELKMELLFFNYGLFNTMLEALYKRTLEIEQEVRLRMWQKGSSVNRVSQVHDMMLS